MGSISPRFLYRTRPNQALLPQKNFVFERKNGFNYSLAEMSQLLVPDILAVGQFHGVVQTDCRPTDCQGYLSSKLATTHPSI